MLARPLASIHAGDIRAHLVAELRRGKKPATVARAKTTLSALFTYADQEGLLHQPHPVRTMQKIPELAATQRSVGPADTPTREQLAAKLSAVREKREDVADLYEFKSLTALRWGEIRAARVGWFVEVPLPQFAVGRSHSNGYDEKDPKSWRGTRVVPLSPRAVEIYRKHAIGEAPDDYLFTNRLGGQFAVGLIRKPP